MKRGDEMLIERLRALDPVSEEEVDRALDAPAASALLHSILVSERSASHRRRHVGGRESWPRRAAGTLARRRVLVPVAAATAIALAILVSLPGGVGDHRAVAALDRVADTAASRPRPALDRPYLYLKTRSTSLERAKARGGSWRVYRSEVRGEWVGERTSGRVRVVELPPRFIDPADRAAWRAAGGPRFQAWTYYSPSIFNGAHRPVVRSIPPGTSEDDLSDKAVLALPTEPAALLRRLLPSARALPKRAPIAARMLEAIGGVLRNPAATPELRAALYEAVKRIPGIEYLGEASDEIGRRGVAVGLTSSSSGNRLRYSLIFNPRTSEVLATEHEALDSPRSTYAKPPVLTYTTVYVSSGTAGSLSETP
jgi:hypothetical protein